MFFTFCSRCTVRLEKKLLRIERRRISLNVSKYFLYILGLAFLETFNRHHHHRYKLGAEKSSLGVDRERWQLAETAVGAVAYYPRAEQPGVMPKV